MQAQQQSQNEVAQQPQPKSIQLDRQKSKVIVYGAKPELTYIIISTEPGRKIFYPPTYQYGNLQFGLQKSQGISIQSQAYCAIGLNHDLTGVEEFRIVPPCKKMSQKVLYISKIKASIKFNSQNYLKNPKQHYNLTVGSLPPKDITATQIQQFLDSFVQIYGQIEKVDAKRNCLILYFKQEVQIKDSFILKEVEANGENGDRVINYWGVTSHRALYTYEPIKLIQLPSNAKIRDYVIHAQWLIISTQNDVLFLHLYRPCQNFMNLNDIKVHAICPLEKDRVMLFEYKFFYFYQLYSYKNPQLIGKAKTKKIEPYTVASRKKTVLFGGINYSSLLNQPTEQKQIYVIQHFSSSNLVNKNFLPDKKLSICKKDVKTPIKNLKHLAKNDLFVCSCGQSIYLFHYQSSSLIASVDLLSKVRRLFQIQYPINLVNLLVSAKGEKNLIRISFEQYGEVIGTEVSSVEKYGTSLDFYAHGKQKFSTDGDNLLFYGASDKNIVLYSSSNQEQKIKRVSIYKQFLSFLLQKKNIIQAYFMEL